MPATAQTTTRVITALAALAVAVALVVATAVTLRSEQTLERHLEFHRCDNRGQHEEIIRVHGKEPSPRPTDLPDCPNGTTP